MKKRIIALLLMFALSVTVLAACQNGNDNSQNDQSAGSQAESTAVSVDPNAGWKDENGNWKPKHEVKDLSDKTFRIIVRGTSAVTYQSDDFTYGEANDDGLYGENLDNAVKDRNNRVEEIYHVTLEVDKNNSINDTIRNDIEASTGDYDAIMPTLSVLATLASEDKLVDLNTIENFDIYAPWYDKNATDAFSIANHVYFTTGDITILNKVCSPSVLFNKDMITTYHLDNPYQLVRDKEWTFDKMMSMAKQVAIDNGDFEKNVYGMVTDFGDPFNFLGGSGEKIIEKDENDLPYLSIGNARSVSIAQHILDTYAAGDTYLIHAHECPDPIWVTSLAVFGEGRALFRPSAFSATTKLRKQSVIEFGIVPLPLMDETQEDYVSYCGTGEVAGIAIPTSAPDYDFSAYMIDAYSAYAKVYITHAYTDINLYQRDARDDESEEMLDIIFSHIAYDMGECYNIGGYKSTFYELCKQRSTDLQSKLSSVEESAKSKIQEIIDDFGR